MDVIDNFFLDKISEKAKDSSRLRFSYDLRNSENDSSQRVLNALEPGTVVPIHRHMQSSEVVFVVRGKIKLMIYDDNEISIEGNNIRVVMAGVSNIDEARKTVCIYNQFFFI